MSQTKTKLMQAKQYIQVEEYEKARRILKGIDHPTAAKWLQKLDIIAPPKKSNPQTAMFIKLGLIVAGLLIVIVFAISQVNENRAIDNRIEETHQKIEQAINDCREYGYSEVIYLDSVAAVLGGAGHHRTRHFRTRSTKIPGGSGAKALILLNRLAFAFLLLAGIATIVFVILPIFAL